MNLCEKINLVLPGQAKASPSRAHMSSIDWQVSTFDWDRFADRYQILRVSSSAQKFYECIEFIQSELGAISWCENPKNKRDYFALIATDNPLARQGLAKEYFQSAPVPLNKFMRAAAMKLLVRGLESQHPKLKFMAQFDGLYVPMELKEGKKKGGRHVRCARIDYHTKADAFTVQATTFSWLSDRLDELDRWGNKRAAGIKKDKLNRKKRFSLESAPLSELGEHAFCGFALGLSDSVDEKSAIIRRGIPHEKTNITALDVKELHRGGSFYRTKQGIYLKIMDWMEESYGDFLALNFKSVDTTRILPTSRFNPDNQVKKSVEAIHGRVYIDLQADNEWGRKIKEIAENQLGSLPDSKRADLTLRVLYPNYYYSQAKIPDPYSKEESGGPVQHLTVYSAEPKTDFNKDTIKSMTTLVDSTARELSIKSEIARGAFYKDENSQILPKFSSLLCITEPNSDSGLGNSSTLVKLTHDNGRIDFSLLQDEEEAFFDVLDEFKLQESRVLEKVGFLHCLKTQDDGIFIFSKVDGESPIGSVLTISQELERQRSVDENKIPLVVLENIVDLDEAVSSINDEKKRKKAEEGLRSDPVEVSVASAVLKTKTHRDALLVQGYTLTNSLRREARDDIQSFKGLHILSCGRRYFSAAPAALGAKIETFPALYEIHCSKGPDWEVPEWVYLSMMDYTISHKQPTVQPFFFKHQLEYFRKYRRTSIC